MENSMVVESAFYLATAERRVISLKAIKRTLKVGDKLTDGKNLFTIAGFMLGKNGRTSVEVTGEHFNADELPGVEMTVVASE
ncbi:MAG: hypothetical protein LBK41_06205 [Clostridiales bacterium]|jgi:hypothetical protein|nr:hypothetical protein [Clostridiales bacterium]